MKLTVPIKANIHNRFDIEVVRDGETVKKAYAENMILNSLWTKMIGTSRAAYFHSIHFGTGEGTLSASRTSLFTFLGAKVASAPIVSRHGDEGYVSCRRSIQLAPEEYVGQELSEVGIGYGTASGNLVTHATLKDMNGNPTTIEKTALDIINIYATVYFQYPTTGWYNGGVYMFETIQSEASLSDSPTGVERCPDAILLGVFGIVPWDKDFAMENMYFINTLARSNISNSYTPISKLAKRATPVWNSSDKKITQSIRLAVGECNFEPGIMTVLCCIGTPYYGGTTPNTGPTWLVLDLTNPYVYSGTTIEGDPIGTGDGVTQDFQTRRVVNSSGATIKVDGVEVSSGVTVDTMKPRTTSLMHYIRDIRREHINNTKISSTHFLWTNTSSNRATGADGSLIFENTMYEDYGIPLLSFVGQFDVSVSTDMETWVFIGTSPDTNDATVAIPAEYQKYRYWKIDAISTTAHYAVIKSAVTSSDLVDNLDNVHFDTAPAAGAVITADYVTPMVAKDSDHVFDLTLELQFGEYTPS